MSRPLLHLRYKQGKHHYLYNTARWRGLRAEQLDREPLCRFCLDQDKIKPATVADHVEPHGGDQDKFWNGELQSLCAACHNSIKKQMEMSGRVRGARIDGKPIDPGHPWNRNA